MTETKLTRGVKEMIDNDSHWGDEHIGYTRTEDDRVVVVDEYRYIWSALADLFLSSVPYGELHERLADMGIMNPQSGKPFGSRTPGYFLLNPVSWGHRSYNTLQYIQSATKARNRWLYEEAYEDDVPKDVYIRYNLHEPLWTGTTGRQVLDEIYRRQRDMGRGRSAGLFTNIFVCGICGRVMSSISSEGAVRCRTYYRRNDKYYQQEGVTPLPECEPGVKLTYEEARQWFTPRLKKAVQYQDLSIITMQDNNSDYILDTLNDGIEMLWMMPEKDANDILRVALGHKQLAVMDNQIIGVLE